DAERVVAHLVAQSARAGMDHDGGLSLLDAERPRGACVVHALHALHLEEMVPGAERADLRPAPHARRLRDRVRIRAAQAAAVLAVLEVGGAPEALLDGPRRAPPRSPPSPARGAPHRHAQPRPAAAPAQEPLSPGRPRTASRAAAPRRARRRRTPQLMSNPMPPGVIPPSSPSSAATPPIG